MSTTTATRVERRPASSFASHPPSCASDHLKCAPPPLSHLTCVLELVRSPSATTRSSPPPLTLPTTPPPLLLLLLASSYSPYRPAALQSHMATWLHEHIPAPVALSQICKPRDPITGRAGPSVGQHTLLHELLTHVSGLLLPEEAKACAALAADHKAPSGKTEVRVRARARSRGRVSSP